MYPATRNLARTTGHIQAVSVPRVPSPAAAVIGENIREARAAKEWTQDQLAAETGIDSSNIRAYESGRSLTNLHSLVRISAALAIDPGTLLKGLTPDLFLTREDDARRNRTHRGRAGSAA